jgi:hypothetical protein
MLLIGTEGAARRGYGEESRLQILSKLGVREGTRAVVKALEHGYV